MRTWNLGSGDPLTLSLAADARLAKPDYANDHIWEMSIGGSEPAAMTLQTTYGLRAHWMRLFPRFKRKDIHLSDPALFFQRPVLTAFYPNYLSFKFSPFADIEVHSEYWVPESGAVAGRLRLNNLSSSTENLRLELVSNLNPLVEGEGMRGATKDMVNVVTGKVENLVPVLCVSGNSEPCHNPYPGLSFLLELLPGNFRQYTWALASLSGFDLSYALAKKIISSHWDGEISKLELYNASQLLDIRTGDPDWDAAFALSQKTAFSLFISDEVRKDQPTFELSRQPDQGFSRRTDGIDYSHYWKSQSPLDVYYLINLILPGGVALARAALTSLFSEKEENGDPTCRQSTKPQPLLAVLAWHIFQYSAEVNWLADIYPYLIDNLKKWFAPDNDQDLDNLPEWAYPEQTGLSESPIYDCWHSEASQGVDISTLETPSLASFLFKECSSLIQIAGKIDNPSDLPWLEERSSALQESLTSCWDNKTGVYNYCDFASHLHPSGLDLVSFRGSGSFPIKRSFKTPLRLLIQLNTEPENTIPVEMNLFGHNPEGEVSESITFRKMTWSHNRACYTSRNLFSKVTRIDISGIDERAVGHVKTVDYTLQDYSLFLPLWADMVEREKARDMMHNVLIPHYLKPFGFSICPDDPGKEGSLNDILLPWNNLLGEALILNGDLSGAADLVGRLMKGIIPFLKKDHAFRERFNSSSGQPAGERNSLHGLAPIGLFLKTLGIQLFTPTRIILKGANPFPWPVTVKYRGISVTCHAQESVVTFPNGQTITVTGEGPHNIIVT